MAIRSAPRLHIGIAVLLAFLAGCVDAVGFAMLGGLFVSFMSGNSTRLGVFIADGQFDRALQVLGVIAAFVAGAALGSILTRTTGRGRQTTVLLTEATLLALAGILSRLGPTATAPLLMATAMGLENATFVNERGETNVNLTFMTGALVKFGEGLGAALTGGSRLDWWPYPILWLGLMSGATVGTLTYGWAGADVLYALSLLVVATAFVLRASVPTEPKAGEPSE